MYTQTQMRPGSPVGADKGVRPGVSLGYSYVPCQQCVGKVYSPDAALIEGTIFPELNITIDEYERGLYNGK